MKLYFVFSLESPHRGGSNEYTQYTIYQYKKENHSKLSQICNYGICSKGLKKEFETAVVNEPSVFEPLQFYYTCFYVMCFWPGLGLPRPKAIVVIPQNQPLPKHLRKKTSKSAKHACHYATKERPVKITMYLGLDIII